MKTLIQKRKYITSNHFRPRLNVQIYSFFFICVCIPTRSNNAHIKRKASKYRFKTKQKKNRQTWPNNRERKYQTIQNFLFLLICIASTQIMAITIWHTHKTIHIEHIKEALVLFIYTYINICTICREKERLIYTQLNNNQRKTNLCDFVLTDEQKRENKKENQQRQKDFFK